MHPHMRTRTLLLTIGLVAATVVGTPVPASARDCDVWGVQIPRDETRERFLDDVAASSSCLAWAVGSVYEAGTYETLVMRWDGDEWAQVPTPNRAGSNTLISVAAISAKDAWAVWVEKPA